ncbi:unnamed protein product [Rotaria sp. Silwood1]|nr:unnamed protein product [Rotaria sp. Silwood1]
MGSHHLRVILLNLVDHLSENDRERLRFYIGPDVPRIIRDDSSFAGILRLWESLFDQDKINEEDFTYLINALDEIHCRDAVKLLREHMRRMQAHGLKESLENLASIIPPTAPHITIEEILGDQDKDDKLALKSQSSKTTFDGIWLKPGNGKIPSDAVVGGQEGNKLVYIARSKLVNNCIIPGKLVEGTEKAIITHFGVHSSSNYEVLIRSNPEQEFKWSATRNAIVPEGALVAGKEEAVLVYVASIDTMSIKIFYTTILLLLIFIPIMTSMKLEEKNRLRLQVLDMFKHAFSSYMKYAYPADELMPLSCKGRYRGSEPSRGDIDDALGNFSLTLVDSLDSLAVLGMFDEFERAIRQVIQHVTFDRDVVVSVFETNIRMVGGLLGGHICAKYIHLHYPSRLSWYRDELLILAHDLALRLLPAFNTTSGLPLPRVNLHYGIDLTLSKSERERYTCTACAGTLILEWATLSRLTGNYLFEQYADRAMSYLWERRHRQSNLMGTILNVHSGDWIVRESGIGAGIDSYYEYLFKAYVLLGEKNNDYLLRFEEHYSSIMSYVQRGVAMINVHMHQPYRSVKKYMDALLAFWPGLQVLTGDLKSAIELHEMLYNVVKKHKFLPEAFTTDYRIHWKSHPLRPEFVESTYFLYKATGDPHYLEVGKTILTNLEEHARVSCGYAALSDVSTGQKEDRMDSFVLAETFKYLYLLFDSIPHHYIDIDQFIFTTEGHLLPLNILLFNINDTLKNEFNQITLKSAQIYEQKNFSSSEKSYERKAKINQCPAMDEQFKSHQYKEKLRENIRGDQDMTETITISSKYIDKQSNNISHHRLTAMEFSADNPQHISELKQMGIEIQYLIGGQIQLAHIASNAESIDDAENGLIFMQDMIELMKNTNTVENSLTYHIPLTVIPLIIPLLENPISFTVITAQFGKQLHDTQGIFAQLYVVEPYSACSEILYSHYVYSRIGIVRRGDCMFIEKAYYLEKAQAIAGIVIDNNISLNSSNGAIFSMSGDGKTNVNIPLVLMLKDEAYSLLYLLSKQPNLFVYIGEEDRLMDSFYQQIDYLESLIEPFNRTTNKWIYGQIELFKKIKQCSIVPKNLKQLELTIQQYIVYFTQKYNDPSFNLDLTTFNFDDQLNSMDVYPTTFDEPFQEVIYINKQSLNFNTTIDIQEEQINQFVEIDEETNEDE